MEALEKNSIIEKLEKSYQLKNGKLGSIPIAGKNDCYFLDVEKETEKTFYLQLLEKLFWLPKSAFYSSSSFDGIDYFAIKTFFYNLMLSIF